METRCVLPSMRNIAAPADCTRPLLGSGRNRYVSAAPAWSGTPGLAAQNNKSRLSVAANKFCLKGRTFKIWSCCPAPYGCGQHVCAALTGRVLQPAPGAAVVMMRQRRNFGTRPLSFDNKPIFIYARLDGRDPQNRQSGNQKHKIPRGSSSTGGGNSRNKPDK